MPSKYSTLATAALLLLASVATAPAPVDAGDRGESVTPASPRVSGCTPVEVRAVHGGELPANARLARIENGRVPCLHVEEMTVASCDFAQAGEVASGTWLESPAGHFARLGQAITRDGKPGGEWIVAARVGAGESAFCSEPTGMDTAGRIAPGTALALSCMVEEGLMVWNALSVFGWAPLVNATTLEVCSLDDPAMYGHPDRAEFVRSYAFGGGAADDIFCHAGQGAALNDINGTERDETGNYLPGQQFCHMVVTSGYEVPGAKRPATKSLPAPGIVNVRSYIVWRPVNPNVVIAN